MWPHTSHLPSLSFCFFIHQWEYRHLPHRTIKLLESTCSIKTTYFYYCSARYFRSNTFSSKYYSKHTSTFTRCQLQWQATTKLLFYLALLALTLDRQICMWLFPWLQSTVRGHVSGWQSKAKDRFQYWTWFESKYTTPK